MPVINALGPIFLLVLIGAGLRRWNFPGGDFWPLAERTTYFLFFPALLIRILATAPYTASKLADVFLVVLLLLGSAAVLLLALRRWIAPTDAAFTSVFQGAIRLNTYVGLAAASSLFGEAGLAVAAMVVACMVPFVNLLCIGVFAWRIGRSGGSLTQQIALNPLILACVVGVSLNLSGVGLPGWSNSLLEILGRPALPLGLLAIGVGLTFESAKSSGLSVAISSTIKLLIMPALAFAICRTLNVQTQITQVLVLFAALPTASSAYILARQLGGDAPLMAAVITVQTLAAMLSMPLLLKVF
ncbi:MAG: AEC family transporter [Pseudomonadota bacterium]